ncbi:hypothetical protein HYV10_00505 [Candidatus Dependentiae bacterium]|nr:hypothetical protein [Candidatus Dependentiae bacterium]
MRFLHIILFCFAIKQLEAVDITVWVHGTYPALKVLRAKWCPVKPMVYVEDGLSLAKKLPKNYYFYKLAESLHELEPRLYNLNHIYTYGWHSSNVSPKQRIKEGKNLYKAIEKLLAKYQEKYRDIKLRIVGFSHGGNVILNMISHLPFKKNCVPVEVVLMGTPVQESTRHLINSPYIKKAYSFYSQGDWIQRIDIQRFHCNCPNGSPFLSSRVFRDTDKVQQICLTINGKKIGHTKYRSILKYLPDMMLQVEQKLCQNPLSQMLHFDYKITQQKNSKKKRENK